MCHLGAKAVSLNTTVIDDEFTPCRAFPVGSLQQFNVCPFVQKCKQLSATGTFPSLWKGWLLSKAGQWHGQGMRWAGGTEGTVPVTCSPYGSSTAIPRATQGSLCLYGTHTGSVWFYQYKVIKVSGISPFYRIKPFPPCCFLHSFTKHTHITWWKVKCFSQVSEGEDYDLYTINILQ